MLECINLKVKLQKLSKPEAGLALRSLFHDFCTLDFVYMPADAWFDRLFTNSSYLALLYIDDVEGYI